MDDIQPTAWHDGRLIVDVIFQNTLVCASALVVKKAIVLPEDEPIYQACSIKLGKFATLEIALSSLANFMVVFIHRLVQAPYVRNGVFILGKIEQFLFVGSS